MVIALAVLVVILTAIIVIQYFTARTRSSSLMQIHNKLNEIIAGGTSEKLLVFTDDRAIIPLLIEINHLLEYNQQREANFLKMEQSMRKMTSNISHDLKTPLTVVLGYIETINLDPDMSAEERKVLLSRVHAKANEVLELIRQFFDLARLESGDKPIPLSQIHMNDICGKNMLAFYDTLTVKGFEVSIEIPDKPLLVWGNEEALDRVLNNLIANAIQHGGEGMTIGLTLRADNDFVYVDIWDRGKGIDELHQDRVFERMYTLEDSRNKSYQGSGLGLTITKRLVEAQGGTIRIYSKPYEKTMFTIKLKRTAFTA
ncbi:signal transduction histidine kinase [Paenibacillus cellulosilyticus]|uniref:histidine kinase n=1 Tax=Paenibacillus cellulosilyticus TaxID=375489 RepID=A0A2V2YMV1_9BACL|nr:sensor histidine kinase [Paenibacillus cellulosilyticus]PWV95168.1 signal transduction histidine kinase [Paenibacillus cellulosilyticus]QKS46076.1 sensor histidine kinase [Paenibacillus cellulosilyticus]